MQPSLGVIKADPDDGVLRGRAGAKRWFFQLLALLIVGFIFGIILIVFLVETELIAFIIFLILFGLVGMGLRVFALPCAWLGVDLYPPVVFDLAERRFEIGGWNKCIFERKTLAGDRILDLQVFSSSAGATGFDDFKAFREAGAIESQLPRAADAAHECGQSLKQLFVTERTPAEVACGVLAAKVREKQDPVYLSRCAWNLREVEELCRLARAAREHLGLPETPAPTASEEDNAAEQEAPRPATRNGREEPPPQVVGSAEANSASVAPPAGQTSTPGSLEPDARAQKNQRVVRFADPVQSTESS